MLPPNIRAVAFDAGGTLLFPSPPAAQIYTAVGQRFGSRLTPAEIGPRFRAAFDRQERVDAARGYRTDERREEERWRQIVAEVLDDVTNFEACFRELYEHYRRPDAWACPADTSEVLDALAERGCVLAVGSNYDCRLHAVVAGLAPLRRIGPVVISAEVGWRKPAPEFFAALCQRVGLSPQEILFIGDDLVNDYDGARAAGLHALLFDRAAERGASLARIRCFRQLLRNIPGKE